MNIAWKDGEGNILNANREKIIYMDVSKDKKTIIKKEEIKKITIDDGLMNIFKDFKNDLVLTIVIPKGSKKDAVKIFNEYDKTGDMYNKGTGNILTDVFLNVFLDLSLSLINPIAVMLAVPLILLIMFNITKLIAENLFGNIGTYIAYITLLGYPTYLIIQYIHLRIKRKNLKEN